DLFDTCPVGVIDQGLIKIQWDKKRDSPEAKLFIVRLANLLSRLRATIPTWSTEDTQGSDYAYQTPSIEEPSRAATQLYNLTRGCALSRGRTYITQEDLAIAVSVVLSTGPSDRVSIFETLLSEGGTMLSSQLSAHRNISRHTVHRVMKELEILGLAFVDSIGAHDNSEKRITLSPEFLWCLSPEFAKLRQEHASPESKDEIK